MSNDPTQARPPRDPTAGRTLAWQLLLVVAVSAGYEAAFLHSGLNTYDEGWPLYAAMQLHEGGVLFRDVFFVFPPGHVFAAWVAYALDPPGIILARAIYAAFNVLLCVALYLLGRRLMSPGFALLGALLLAIAAPESHLFQYHFGYRYLAISVLALLAFARRLDTGDARWLAVAGALTGLALCFRLTPAFSVGVAIGVGVVLAERDWRSWLRDWSFFAAGIALVALPAITWFAWDVGLETLVREAVIRPVAMTEFQSKPIPDLLVTPASRRLAISRFFTALQFRIWGLLYAAYALALLGLWLRDLQNRRRFESVLLFVVVIWGASFFLRTLGRSDAGHLESALPPVCLLLAHLASLLTRGLVRAPGTPRRVFGFALAATLLVTWVFLFETDQRLTASRRGSYPIETLHGSVSLAEDWRARSVDERVLELSKRTGPGDTILDLSAAPLYHVLSARRGPGWSDVVVPGTFLSDDEERAFVERLAAQPPALVVAARQPFDRSPERATSATAPLLAAWLRSHYRVDHVGSDYKLWLPRE